MRNKSSSKEKKQGPDGERVKDPAVIFYKLVPHRNLRELILQKASQ